MGRAIDDAARNLGEEPDDQRCAARVVALAARASGTCWLKTFSVGFVEESYDERPFARVVAAQCGTEHEEVVFSAEDAKALIEVGS